MKKRDTLLFLGITAIAVLISVQVYIVSNVLKQKNEMFNLRYRVFSQDAVNSMWRMWHTDGFDTARLVISGYSAKAINEMLSLKNDSAIAAKKKDIHDFVLKALIQEQDLSAYLSNYFGRMGIDKNFTFKIVLNRFDLINNDSTIHVYSSEAFSNRRNRTPNTAPAVKRRPPTEILVRGVTTMWDKYNIDFDCFIDFSDKQKLILKDTSASLAMSMFSIIVVVMIFMIAYRNLMEEKRLSNLKTDFINNMTHELKTPLSTITVAGKTLEMVQIRTNEEKIMETAKLIGKQSVHLNQLINMILEISMWERTQFQLDKKNIDIEEFMHDVVDSFRSGSGNGSVISQKYDLKGIKADLDVVYFTTLVNNLLSNAVKYSDKAPVIDIEGYTLENNICLTFADNGIGISKSDQKHIFDKFYRASTGNIHKFKGLGLGLYYVKKIAEAHGGDVSVSSKPGKGSMFTVTIPNIS